uniref:Cwf15/Cwc15 cell cycle control protein n=1 Tax=Tetradesmus obliquus TaxID=3088 RepID=A0A383VEF7_TETOB|eukprot:jgi/Sobl393_1/17344/SZX63044.1
MTTAHRPTWAPARGGEEQGGMRIFAPSKQVSAKNQAAHTKMKFRQEGQAAPHELKSQDLKAKLEEKERKHFQKTKGINFEEERKADMELLEAAPPDEGGGGSRALIPNARDADDVDADASSDDSSDDDDDDSDDEAELKAELERIRAERAVEAERRAAEEEAKRQEAIRSEVLGGNPLMAGAGEVDFGVKRRWDEDVVFKNQTRGEAKAARRFINDTVRSDFHKKFLERYIR